MFNNKIFYWCISILSLFFYSSNAQYLKISDNKRYIQNEDGTPFLWIGDTAWELFHKLDREEATEYLKNRAEKGFTVIQAVVLAENNGLRTPNPYGDVPFEDLDPTKPNDDYFTHVDFIVNKAQELGLYIGMLPTWGDKVRSENPGAGPVVFNAENAEVFGCYLGERYKDKPIVWILGGDRNVMDLEVYEIWNSMAKGIKEGDGGQHLMSYHPRGTSTSAYWYHNKSWLDFNMYQSGHERFNKVYTYAEDMYMLHPAKPFIDGEPAYEDIAVKFWEFMDFSKYSDKRVPEGVLNDVGLIQDKSHFKKGFITPYDVRVHAYWNFLAGACGYTYGNNAIWQMYKIGGEIAIPALTDWKEAMDRPGAEDMSHVRALFESRPFNLLVPDQSIIFGVNRDDDQHIRASGSKDNSYALIYLAVGQKVQVVMDVFAGNEVIAWWFDPREGTASKIGEYDETGIKTFTPPSSGKGNDWVLVIDSKTAGYEMPGNWQKD